MAKKNQRQAFEEIGHAGGRMEIKYAAGKNGGGSVGVTYTHSSAGGCAMIQMGVALDGSELRFWPIYGVHANPPEPSPMVSALLISDREQMWGRECPQCHAYFRTNQPGQIMICPYCAHRARNDEFTTKNQKAFIDRIRKGYLEAWEGKKDVVLDLDKIADGLPENRPAWAYNEERQQNAYACKVAKCDTRYDVLGRYAGCPNCGHRNSLQVLDGDLAAVAEKLKLAGPEASAMVESELLGRCFSDFEAMATHNGTTLSYTPNSLNQYDARDVAGAYDVAGQAPGSAVTVSLGSTSYTATRHGNYFFKAYPLSNTSNPVFANLSIADNTSPTPNTGTAPAFLAKTPEVFPAATSVTPAPGYDHDGNLLRDGRWNYTYDAENRVLTAETNTAAITANAPAQRLTFVYDYLGRRISKLVESGSSYGTIDLSLRYVYNGWNVMAELNHQNSDAVIRSYYWGLDLTGTMQGAGGVGGLLMVQGAFINSETSTPTTTVTDTGKTLLAVYDAMGNLHGMLNTASVTGANSTTYSAGSFVAAYEYDAFGNTLRESGPYAATNPFRFSTKYSDVETGLVYYGLRYYSPTLGRFINRDPLQEKGGLNLYAFGKNGPVNGYDLLGQNWIQFVTPVYAWVPTYNPSASFWGSLFSFSLQLVGYSVNFVWVPEPGRPLPPPNSVPGMNKIPVPLTPVPKPVDPTKTTANITVLMKNLGFAEGSSIATIYNGSDPQSPVGSIVTDGRSFTATANTIAKSTLFRRGDSINPTSLADATEKLGLNSGLGGVVVIDHGYFDGANILKEQLNDSFYQTVSAALDPDGARLLLLMGCNVGGHDGAIEMFTSLASKYNINIIVANNDVAFLSGGGEYNSTIQPNGFRWIRVNSDGTIRYFYGNGYESAAPPTAPPDTGTSTPGAPPSVAPPPPSPQSPREPVFPRDRNLEP